MPKDEKRHELSTLKDVTGLTRDDSIIQRSLLIFGRSLLVVIPVLALFGVLDAQTETQTKSNAAMEVEFTTTSVTRAGNPVPLEITIRSNEPLTEPVTVEICGEYFDYLDFQNWYPNPSAETRSDDGLSYEFDPPLATEFAVALDARAAPNISINSSTCEVSVSTSVSSLSATFSTWRLP